MYLRAVERLEAMPNDCSGADKSWVEESRRGGGNHWARSGAAIFTTQYYDLFLPLDPEAELAAWQACQSVGLELWSDGEPLGQPLDRWLAEAVVNRRALVRASDGRGLDVDLSLVMAGFDFETVWSERRIFLVDGVEIPVARLGHIVESKARAGREGVVAQYVLSRGENGSYLAINLGWGIAVVLGCYVAGGVSGAHMNPAVTLALAVLRGFPWREVPAYVAAQVAGAFAGAALAFSPEASWTRSWARPSSWPSSSRWATAATRPPRRARGPSSSASSARDLGPRLFTALAGWGGEVFRAGNGWWWVPLAGPVLGGVLGGLVYDLFVGKRHPSQG